MMDDRELLELAARAAGLKARWFPEHAPGLKLFGVNAPWNPLADDGDALRLAVSLGMTVDVQTGLSGAHAKTDDSEWHYERHDDHGDPYAATRRAIVRAAAAIAQEMTDAKG